jgi:hypothetical protein
MKQSHNAHDGHPLGSKPAIVTSSLYPGIKAVYPDKKTVEPLDLRLGKKAQMNVLCPNTAVMKDVRSGKKDKVFL